MILNTDRRTFSSRNRVNPFGDYCGGGDDHPHDVSIFPRRQATPENSLRWEHPRCPGGLLTDFTSSTPSGEGLSSLS